VDHEDKGILARLGTGDMVPVSDPQHERLNRLAATGYVVLVNRKTTDDDIPLEPVYRLTVRGRAYLEDRKRKGE
jgi:hypothetical protein